MDTQKLNRANQIQEEIDWMKSTLTEIHQYTVFGFTGASVYDIRHALDDKDEQNEINGFTAKVKKEYIELLEALLIKREIEFELL